MYVFHSPLVVGIECTLHSGVCYNVEFDNVPQARKLSEGERKQFWRRSKRLTHGCLVCLCWKTAGEEKPTFIFATVCGRDEDELVVNNSHRIGNSRRRPCIQLSTKCNGHEFNQYLIDQLQSGHIVPGAVLLQASDDFFSYEPVLKALQGLNPVSVPFARYLARSPTGDHTVIAAPEFLSEDSVYDLSGLLTSKNVDPEISASLKRVQILDPFSRGSAMKALREHSTMDESQLLSLETALVHELCLVQGPPGTGKSFVGIKIVQILVKNTQSMLCMDAFDEEQKLDLGPILCVCYTNHALDQFLEGLVEGGMRNLVRLGGRSQSKQMKAFSISELSKQCTTSTQSQLLWECKQALKRIQDAIQSSCRILSRFQTRLSMEDVREFLDAKMPELLRSLLCMDRRSSQRHEPSLRRKGNKPEDAMDVWQRGPCPFPGCARHNPAIQDKRKPCVDLLTTCPIKGLQAWKRVSLCGVCEKSENILVRDDSGTMREISRRHTVPLHTTDRPIHDLLKLDDAWLFSDIEKFRLCEHVRSELRSSHSDSLSEKIVAYSAAREKFENVRNQTDLEIMLKASVVGVTTSGAAKYQNVLSKLGSRIIVVEEAAGDSVCHGHIYISK